MNPIETVHRYAMCDGKGDPTAHVEVVDRVGVLWLTNLWVTPEQRRKGCAVALMVAAVAAWQAHDVYLQVQPYTDQIMDVDALAALYRSFGFSSTPVPGIMHRPARPWVGRVPPEEQTP